MRRILGLLLGLHLVTSCFGSDADWEVVKDRKTGKPVVPAVEADVLFEVLGLYYHHTAEARALRGRVV